MGFLVSSHLYQQLLGYGNSHTELHENDKEWPNLLVTRIRTWCLEVRDIVFS